MISEKSSNQGNISSKSFWFITMVLFVLAVVLRWYRLDLMMFRYDQAAIAFRAMDTFRTGLPLTGIVNSLGFHNSPGYVWSVLPAFLISPDPRWATGLHGLFASTMIVPLALLGRKYRADWLMWVPAIMAAVLPASVFAGRNLWAQYLLPPLIAWAIWAIDSAIDENNGRETRRRHAGLALALLAWATSVHFSAGTLFVIAAGFALVSFKRHTRDVLISAIPAAIICLTIIPSLVDAYGHFTNPRAKPQFAAEYDAILPPPLPWYVRVPDSVMHSVQNSSLEIVWGIQTYLRPSAIVAIRIFDIAIIVLIAASSIFALLLLLRPERLPPRDVLKRPLAVLLLVWLLIPAVLGGFLVPRVNAGYFLGSLPAGWLLVLLLPATSRRFRLLTRPLPILILVAGLLINLGYLSTLVRHGRIPGVYYITYKKQAELMKYLSLQKISADRWVHLSGEWYDHSYKYIHRFLETPGAQPADVTRGFALVEDKLLRPDQPKRLKAFWDLEPVEFDTVGVKIMPSKGSAEIFRWNYYEMPLE